MNKDQLRRPVADANGKIKEVARNFMGNQPLEANGGVREKLSATLKRSLARSSKTWSTQRSMPGLTPLF